MSRQSSSGQVRSQSAPRLINLTEARFLTLRNLGFSVGIQDFDPTGSRSLSPVTALTVHAEAFRAALWFLSRKGSNAVYITRLIYAMSRLLDTGVLSNGGTSRTEMVRADYDGEVDRNINERLRGVLSEMEILGDVVALPGGYWLPAPLRVIPLRAIRRWLLIGGIPTNQLPIHVQKIIEHTGTSRILSQNPSEINLHLPQQSEEAWCRLPHTPVDVWTQSVLNTPSAKLYEESEDGFEYYAPSIARGRKARDMQFFRWVEPAKLLPDGRYFARRKSTVGPTTYSIAVIQRGRVVATCNVDSGEVDLRRLLYGLDLLAGKPVTVGVILTEGGWSFELKNQLPRSEHRIFMMLGRLSLLSPKHFYPRRWELPTGYAAQAVSALKRLRVRLNDVDGLLKQLAE